MRSIHTFQPRKSGAAEAGIFEPSDGPTLTKQCLTVVDMGRHAAEVHLFGKTFNKNHQNLKVMLSTSISLRKMKTDMLSIVHLYTRYIGWLYATYHQFREPGNFHWHSSSTCQGQVLERDEKASGQGINSGNPNDQLGATARPTLPRLETVLEPPLWFGRLSPGWKGFRQSSFVITNRFRSGVGHVTKKLSERKS